tara:strand:- start:2110 stop:2823 length:714 start_codon:yes stop_codon:yes gene_type:complete
MTGTDWPGLLLAHAVPLWETLRLGGPVVAILILMSVVALAVVLLKIFHFWLVRIGQRRFIRPALTAFGERDRTTALEILRSSRNPIARVLESAVGGILDAYQPEAIIREEAQRVAGDELEDLRSHLRILEIIATLSPLLGLFGTVLGMIDVFQQMANAEGQVTPATLSGGIWMALLTTAVGLAVAMPSLVFHSWFERRIERLTADMESALTRVFTQPFSPSARARTSYLPGHAQPAE